MKEDFPLQHFGICMIGLGSSSFENIMVICDPRKGISPSASRCRLRRWASLKHNHHAIMGQDFHLHMSHCPNVLFCLLDHLWTCVFVGVGSADVPNSRWLIHRGVPPWKPANTSMKMRCIPTRTYFSQKDIVSWGAKKHPYFLVGFRSQIPGDEIHWGNLAGAHFLQPKLDGQIVCKSNIEPGIIILDGQRVFRFLWMFDFLFKFSKRRNKMDGEMVQHCDWKKALPPKSAGFSGHFGNLTWLWKMVRETNSFIYKHVGFFMSWYPDSTMYISICFATT